MGVSDRPGWEKHTSSKLEIRSTRDSRCSYTLSRTPSFRKPRAKSSNALESRSMSSDMLRAQFFAAPVIEDQDNQSCLQPHRHQRKPSTNFGGVKQGIGSKLRRASESIKAVFTIPASKSRSVMEPERSVFEPTPIATSRNSQELEIEDPARPRTGRTNMLVESLSKATNGLSIRGGHVEEPELHSSPYVPLPGAAARLSAARQNQHERISASSSMSYPARRSRVDRDRESAVSLTMEPRSKSHSPEHNSGSVSRIDPLSRLPTELATLIFEQFDHSTLALAEQVSRQWRGVASDPQLWKTIFIRKFAARTLQSLIPGPVGGRGTGQAQGIQDWKRMYRARVDLASNWKNKCATVIHMNGHTDSVYCLQYDEDKIITGSRDRTIRVWDIHTFKCSKVIGVPCALETDRRTLPTMQDAPVKHQDLSTYTLGYRSPDSSIYFVPSFYHNASILCLQYDDEIVVTGSSDCSLIVWDIKTWEPIRRLERHTGGVLDVVFDKKRIVSCSKDTNICIWDRCTGKLLHQLVGHRGPVNAVQMRGDLLVSASGEGCARLWNLESGAPFSVLGGRHSNKENDSVPKCIKEFWSRDRGLACVEFSDDARHILAGGNDRSIYKFDTSTGNLVDTMQGHNDLVRSLYLDSVNGHVISGSYDLSLRVWNFETCEQLLEFPNWSSSWMLSAKCDYRRIISTSQDGRILVVDFGWGVKGVELLKE